MQPTLTVPAAVSNKSQLTNSGYNSSRLGFRGVEDLGGGLSASFWLEAGVNNDNGSLVAATNTNNQTATSSTGGGGLTVQPSFDGQPERRLR